MARRKAERPDRQQVRRAETNAVAAYLTALMAPKVPAWSRDALQRPYGAGSRPLRPMDLERAVLDSPLQVGKPGVGVRSSLRGRLQ
jgi:hypothetical protein